MCFRCIPSIINEDLQGMSARISVLDDKIHRIQVLNHEAQRSIRVSHCCIFPKCEPGKNGRYQRGVIGHPVEHGTISAIVHGGECDFKFDGLRRTRLRDWDYWNKASIIHVVVFVNKSEVG